MNVDPYELARIINSMIQEAIANAPFTTYKRGIVSAAAGQYADVYIEGSTTATQGIISLAHYTPVVGDKVLVASIGNTGVNRAIIGKIPTS